MLYSDSMEIKEIIAEKVVPGGMCFSRIDGKAAFVRGVLPGEIAEVEIVSEKRDYVVTRATSIVKASSRRVEPFCPLFGSCGGCSLQMAEDSYQTELRLSILTEALERFRVPVSAPPSVVSGTPRAYRSRFQFHRAGTEIALREGESTELVPLRDCPVAVREIRQALSDGTLASMSSLRADGERFHVFAYDGRLWHEDRDERVDLDLAGRRVSFDVGGFFQSNIPMLEGLGKSVIRLLENGGKRERLLDMYSGVGTFSLFAGSLFAHSVLVERNRKALAHARENLSRAGIPATACAVSDDFWPRTRESSLPFDAAIVDPPRSGISREALSWLCSSGIPNILYVSCDPVTFSRDAATLTKNGYRLASVEMHDFYPQTHHVETLGQFTL